MKISSCRRTRRNPGEEAMIGIRDACNNIAYLVPLVPRVVCLSTGDLIAPWMLNATCIEFLHSDINEMH